MRPAAPELGQAANRKATKQSVGVNHLVGVSESSSAKLIFCEGPS